MRATWLICSCITFWRFSTWKQGNVVLFSFDPAATKTTWCQNSFHRWVRYSLSSLGKNNSAQIFWKVQLHHFLTMTTRENYSSIEYGGRKNWYGKLNELNDLDSYAWVFFLVTTKTKPKQPTMLLSLAY